MVENEELLERAERNHWRCCKNGRFTWFRYDCTDYGSSDCPLTMGHDKPCGMDGRDEVKMAGIRRGR